MLKHELVQGQKKKKNSEQNDVLDESTSSTCLNKLLKIADVLGIGTLKKQAKFFGKKPSELAESSFFELKAIASMAVNAVNGTFSPYPEDVLKILKGELKTPKPQPKIDPMIQAIVEVSSMHLRKMRKSKLCQL